MTSLDDYLDQALRRPWAWGGMDCCAFAGGWVRAATERDPFGAWRGTYSTAAQALRHVRRAGGLLPLVDAAMRAQNFDRTETLEHGDLALIEAAPADPAHQVAGAALTICCAGFVLARAAPTGLVGQLQDRVKILAAWRVLA
jgi:hypothetical protein